MDLSDDSDAQQKQIEALKQEVAQLKRQVEGKMDESFDESFDESIAESIASQPVSVAPIPRVSPSIYLVAHCPGWKFKDRETYNAHCQRLAKKYFIQHPQDQNLDLTLAEFLRRFGFDGASHPTLKWHNTPLRAATFQNVVSVHPSMLHSYHGSVDWDKRRESAGLVYWQEDDGSNKWMIRYNSQRC